MSLFKELIPYHWLTDPMNVLVGGGAHAAKKQYDYYKERQSTAPPKTSAPKAKDKNKSKDNRRTRLKYRVAKGIAKRALKKGEKRTRIKTRSRGRSTWYNKHGELPIRDMWVVRATKPMNKSFYK